MVNISGKSISRAQVIKIMKEQNVSPELREIVLYNFDTADAGENGVGTEGANDETLKGFEIKYFYKLMGWELKQDSGNDDEYDNIPRAKKAEYNPKDKTTTVYDYNEKTITKYDENNQIIGVTDLDGNPINTKTSPQKSSTPTKPQKEQEHYTREQINQKIQALKPGESFSYTENFAADIGVIKFAEKSPVTWMRNQDGTLTKTYFDPNMSSGRGFKAETVYKDDMKTKVSERKVTPTGVDLGVQSNIRFNSNGEPTIVTTPLNDVKVAGAQTKGGALTRGMLRGNFANQEVRDINGKVILICTNGEFRTPRGKVIPIDKALDILEKSFDNGTIQELVQTY